MKTSDDVSELAAALAAAQSEMPNASFNRVNPHFKSQYADLAAIREATLPALSKNGLSVVQTTCVTAVGFVLFSRLMHKSGQWIEGEFPIAIGSPQSMGSQLTYFRRYSWSGLTGIAADEDDDANAAEDAVPKKSAYKARKDHDWEILTAEMRSSTSLHSLRIWWLANQGRINSLPENWIAFMTAEKERLKAELETGVTEDGKSTLKKQLKKSIAEEIDDEIPDEAPSETI
jgi:hypothetical protein